VDIGTRYAASSLALGQRGFPHFGRLFDVPEVLGRNPRFEVKSEKCGRTKVEAAKVDIKFYSISIATNQ
jgi:hypothetical protein